MKETPIGLPDCPPQRVLIEVFDCAPARQKGRLIFGRKSRRQLAYPATGFLRVQRGIVQAVSLMISEVGVGYLVVEFCHRAKM